PDDPPTLSVGSADDWAEILYRIARGTWVDGQVSARLRHWLGLNTDHSMVAADWALDPLVGADEQDPWLGNKTGSDVGVRADVGLVLTGAGSGTVWAAIADWDDPDPRLTRAVVLDLRDFGRWLRAATG